MGERKDIYFTVTGIFRFEDTEFMKAGLPVTLEKEPDNKFDHEAIKVMMPGIGQIGYVANSIHTVVGKEAFSAGRLYDKIGDTAAAVILYNMGNALQCRLTED